MDHFENPRNLGDLPAPDARARQENPVCGDEAELQLAFEGDVISDIRFRAVGCVAALAACSCLTEMVRGRTRAQANALTAEDLGQELGGLPRSKRHGAALAIDTLRAALRGTAR